MKYASMNTLFSQFKCNEIKLNSIDIQIVKNVIGLYNFNDWPISPKKKKRHQKSSENLNPSPNIYL
jgi:hypothetical protein